MVVVSEAAPDGLVVAVVAADAAAAVVAVEDTCR